MLILDLSFRKNEKEKDAYVLWLPQSLLTSKRQINEAELLLVLVRKDEAAGN
jgi:hypothetical protein